MIPTAMKHLTPRALMRALPSLTLMRASLPPALRRALLLLALTVPFASPFASAPAHAAAKFEDSMAQRTLACTACHGAEGRAGPDGYYPRIAGKPAGYLYNQLLNFRDGRRHYGLMTRLLEPLSDAYLAEIAGHFASLDLPYPAPARVTASPAVLERGRLLALQGDPSQRLPACVACHGSGVMGAPKAHDKAAWSARLGGNLKALVESAIKGKGAMPPKGGAMDATDEEITKAVEFMLK